MNERKTTLLGRRMGYNEQKKRMERNQKIKAAYSHAFRWFKRGGWIACVVIVAAIVVLWQQRFYLQQVSPLKLRHLQRVEIEGNRMLSWDDVMQNAQVETGMLMSELDPDSVKAALMALPLIHSVEVEKKFPSSLFIKLQESTPVLSVLSEGKAVVYSEKGVPLPHSMATAMRLPVMDEESLENVKVLAEFLNVMREEDKDLYEKVSQVNWSEKDKAVEIFYKDVGFKVLYPSSGWTKDDFRLYNSLGNGFVKDLLCAGEVDMRFHGFAYVRHYDKRCVNG